MLSEKEMEDAIAKNPKRFLGEDGLTLVARQHRIGSYIFDLLFKDRHGGKLIVEIQKGTLDREHTYKILDYYDEYKEKNPTEFIELMLIANTIPIERKKRLSSHGISFKEIPEKEFLNEDVMIDKINEENLLHFNNKILQVNNNSAEPTKTPYHFKSLGSSAFINSVRNALRNALKEELWTIKGSDSLSVTSNPIARHIEKYFGKEIVPQIWMERPKNGGTMNFPPYSRHAERIEV